VRIVLGVLAGVVLAWLALLAALAGRPRGGRPRGGALRPPSWLGDAGLLAAVAGLTAALAGGAFLDLDLAVRDWSDAHRPPAAYLLARGLNYLGQGTPLTLLALALAAYLGLRTHSVRPLLPVVAAFLATYLTVGPLKILLHRAPPNNQNGVPHPERLFSDPLSRSYPSGHAANAVVWYWVLALLLAGLLPAAWRATVTAAVRVGAPAVVCVVTTYISFHWLTDTVAGLLIGLSLDRLLRRVPWNTVPLGRRLTAAGWTTPAVGP
jgi:membrane-associated phospholipid phosphatase